MTQRHNEHRDSLDAQFSDFLKSALDEYRAKQAAFALTIASFDQWNIDDESGTLHLSKAAPQATGSQTQSFPLTAIATYLPTEENWAWAWANDAFSEIARGRSLVIKGLTIKTGYQIFETAHFRANANDVDELCAMALQVLRGVAVFKVKNQAPWIFYVVQ